MNLCFLPGLESLTHINQSEAHPEGLLEEERGNVIAVDTAQTHRPGAVQQRSQPQGFSNISLEEQKVLLSLDRLNHQLCCECFCSGFLYQNRTDMTWHLLLLMHNQTVCLFIGVREHAGSTHGTQGLVLIGTPSVSVTLIGNNLSAQERKWIVIWCHWPPLFSGQGSESNKPSQAPCILS